MKPKDFIELIRNALKNINRNYCRLSKINTQNLSEDIQKYQERPFAYEFYHQIRNLINKQKIDLGKYFLQPEVNKTYQHYFRKGKIPDFILHRPNKENQNFAIIEFKLANRNKRSIENDFKKLIEFKKELKYKNIIEVIIGDHITLKNGKRIVKDLEKPKGEKIKLIEYNVENAKTNYYEIKYN